MENGTPNTSITYGYSEAQGDAPRAALLVITKADHVLVTVRHNGRVLLPGGGVDPGENDEMAAKREAKEEFGGKVRVIRKLDEGLHPKKPNKMLTYWECAHEMGKVVNAEPKSHLFVKYIKISQVIELMGDEMTSTVRSYLMDAEQKHKHLPK